MLESRISSVLRAPKIVKSRAAWMPGTLIQYHAPSAMTAYSNTLALRGTALLSRLSKNAGAIETISAEDGSVIFVLFRLS